MHIVRSDVVQNTLVVGDEQDTQTWTFQRIDALRDYLECVDVQAGVGLVHESNFWLEQGHLEDLGALLLATGEAIIDRAVDKAVIYPEQAHLFLEQVAELRRGIVPTLVHFAYLLLPLV